ncbi:MAG: hypothetical protein PHT44_01685 [Candidatus Portnoybacteria bacterium]|nr:hypothetical protein [Candidatus Portnoybacteria bacterium]MDD4982693.1 hypothetical protein [Candidatus Portnoybacteria bacterium]
MKKIVFCLLAGLFIAGCTTVHYVRDLRQFPTYRLGLVQIDWMDPNLRVDIWINSRPPDNPSFTLLPGWQKEWEARSDEEVSVYAKAWIWDKGRKLVVGETKNPICVAVSKARNWDGYGWQIWLGASDFGLENNRFIANQTFDFRYFIW